ncbi:NOTCH-regulated ankyrin repeat protein, partial [Columba livia]
MPAAPQWLALSPWPHARLALPVRRDWWSLDRKPPPWLSITITTIITIITIIILTAACVGLCTGTSETPQPRLCLRSDRRCNTAELQSLLQNMTNCEFNVNSFGPEGQTALHQSLIDGNLELVKLLVKFGADIRLANRDGWSALHIAAFGGHQDIVLYL